jgi:hypothetical protein
MAAVMLLVSHRRNKARVTVTESEMASLRKPPMEQQQPTPAPQMYGYTEEDTTCPGDLQLPIQNHFLQVPSSCITFFRLFRILVSNSGIPRNFFGGVLRQDLFCGGFKKFS